MNVNGRLTAPPQIEVALVTNSVDGMVLEGRNDRPKTRGTTLVVSPFGTGLQTRFERGMLQAGRRTVAGALVGHRKFDPVSAAQRLSVSREAAVRS